MRSFYVSSINRAVQQLIDEREIRELSATYMRGLDRLNSELVRSVFADQATAHYGAFTGGPDQMTDMAMQALAPYCTTQHLLGQINLHVTGDTATGEVYFQAFHQHETEHFDRFICGRYIDRYDRIDGRWLISHRTEVVDWSRTESTTNNYFTLRAQTVRGTRDLTDLSYRPHEA